MYPADIVLWCDYAKVNRWAGNTHWCFLFCVFQFAWAIQNRKGQINHAILRGSTSFLLFSCGRKLRKYATCFRRNQEVCQRCTLGGKSTGHRYVWSNYTASERIFPLSRLNCSVSFCTRTPPLELTAACTGGATRFCDATWGFRTLPRRPLLFPPFVCRVELWILILQYVHDIVHMITIIRRHH